CARYCDRASSNSRSSSNNLAKRKMNDSVSHPVLLLSLIWSFCSIHLANHNTLGRISDIKAQLLQGVFDFIYTSDNVDRDLLGPEHSNHVFLEPGQAVLHV